MTVANLMLEALARLNGLLAHFLNTPGAVFTQGADGEWSAFGLIIPTLTAKGNSLIGAIADSNLYYRVLQDFIGQILVGVSVAGSPAP